MKRTNMSLFTPDNTLLIIFPNLPVSGTEVSETCSNTSSSRSHFLSLPSLPQHTISSFTPCSQYGSTTDGIPQRHEQAARDQGRDRKKNQQWEIFSSTLLPKVSSYSLEHEQHAAYLDYWNILPTTKILKANLMLAHIV